MKNYFNIKIFFLGFVNGLVPEIRSGEQLTLTSAKEAIKAQMKFFHAGYETEIAQYYTGKLPANATQDQLKYVQLF